MLKICFAKTEVMIREERLEIHRDDGQVFHVINGKNGLQVVSYTGPIASLPIGAQGLELRQGTAALPELVDDKG